MIFAFPELSRSATSNSSPESVDSELFRRGDAGRRSPRRRIRDVVAQRVDVASDVWTILIAVGTVAASVIALGIALWSERNRRRDAAAEQLRGARTVLTLCGEAAQYGGIEIVNASNEPIVDVIVLAGECLPWRWIPAQGYGHSHTALLRAGGTWNAGGHWSQSADLLRRIRRRGQCVAPAELLHALAGGRHRVDGCTWHALATTRPRRTGAYLAAQRRPCRLSSGRVVRAVHSVRRRGTTAA